MAQQTVIEDSTILSLIANPTIAQAIPCFTDKQKLFGGGSGGCGSCARKRLQKQREELAKIKSCLIAMSAEKKAELKKILNTQQIKVVYITPAGQTMSSIF